MTDFIHFIETEFIQCIEEMGKGVIELMCVGIVNILKYIPEVQGIHEAVHIRPFSFMLNPHELKTQKICNEAMRENPGAFFLFLIVSKQKRCATRDFTKILGT